MIKNISTGLALISLGFFVNYTINIDKFNDNSSVKNIVVIKKDTKIDNSVLNKFLASKNLNKKNEVVSWSDKKVLIESGDSLYGVLEKAKVSSSESYKIINKIKKYNKDLINLSIGDRLNLKYKNNVLFSFDIYNSRDRINFTKIVLNDGDDGDLIVYGDSVPFEKKIVYINGVIKNSLYVDGISAGMTDKIVVQLSDIFAWDIDFARDIAIGDKFSLSYEQYVSGDDILKYGDIIAAKFSVRRDDFYAIRFMESKKVGYYDLEGRSVEKAFIRSPVKFPRVTSKFTYKRYHPVLKINRPHRGVDYGGRRNKPIMSTGGGVISHIGRKGAYGNAIMVDHGLGYETLYAHMNKFKRGLKKGSSVNQGQIIGYMGKTGLATGVHLHYEFRIDGKHKDPLKIKLPDGTPVKNIVEFNTRKNVFLDMINKRGKIDEKR